MPVLSIETSCHGVVQVNKTVEETLRETNWVLLAEQKLTLIEAIPFLATGEAREEMEGLLNWIDAIQDAAAAEDYPVVFLTTDR